MIETLGVAAALALLICLPLYISFLSLTRTKDKALAQAQAWEERYIELLKAYKALEWKGPEFPQPPPQGNITEQDLLEEAYNEIEATSYGG